MRNEDFKDIVLNGISDGLIVFDKDYKVTFVNDAAIQRAHAAGVTDITSDNVIGRVIWDLWSSLMGCGLDQCLRGVVETRQACNCEYAYDNRRYSVHLYPLADGSVIAFAPEISEAHRKAENEHRKQTKILERSQELAQIGHWTWDVGSGRVKYSETLNKIYGFDSKIKEYSLEEGLQATHPDDMDGIRHSVELILNGGVASPIEYRVVRPDGEIRYCFVQMDAPQKDEFGKVKEVTGIIQDITDRKKSDELKTSLYMRDEFLSIASHELKTPLTSLDIALQLIRKMVVKGTPTSDPQMQTITYKALESCHHLTELVNELLDLTRIRTGKMRLNPGRVDLKDVVEQAIRNVSGEISIGESTITVFESEPVVGEWDANRLTQVVSNLLSNAIKFGGGNAIEIHLRNDLEGPAILSIRDYGCGIESRMHQVIFERFQMVEMAGEMKGLGLGLYIVRQILEAHGGSIELESTPGEGARFTVRLPRTVSGIKD